MKALALKSILASVAQLAGISARQISPEQHIAMVVAVSEALKTVWGEYPWPELCDTQPYYLWPAEFDPRLELAPGAIVRSTRDGATSYWRRKTPRGAGSGASQGTAVDGYWPMGNNLVSTTTYGTGFSLLTLNNVTMTHAAAVGDYLAAQSGTNNAAYKITELIALSPTTTGLVLQSAGGASPGVQWFLPYYPGHVATDWTIAEMQTYIPFPAAASKVTDAWNADPRSGCALRIPFELEGDEIHIPSNLPLAWLETVAAEVELDGTFWVATEAATVGMVRYSDPAGDCFRCIQAKAGNSGNPPPEADAAFWQRVQIPALLASPTKYLASADLLRADGKETTALARERKAEDALERALQSVNEHQHQTARWGVKQ